jgi:hypothetical protein
MFFGEGLSSEENQFSKSSHTIEASAGQGREIKWLAAYLF